MMRQRKWVFVLNLFLLLGIVGAAASWMVSWMLKRHHARTVVETVIADLEVRGIAKTIADFEADKPREEENAAPLLEEAFALAESIPPLPDSEADWMLPDVPEAVRKRISIYDSVYELIYRAVQRPRCRFDTGWTVQGYSGDLPLSGFRELVVALAVRPIVRSEEGDLDGALEDLRVLFGLTRALREAASLGLIGQMARVDVAGDLVDILQTILPRCVSPIEAFERVSPDTARGAIAFGLQGELAMALWIAVNTESYFERQGTEVPSALVPSLKVDAAHLVRELGNYVEIARKPYPEALYLAEAVQARANSDVLGRKGGVISAIRMTILPIDAEARHASRVALVKLGAKCLGYRREHLEYPRSLEVLPDAGLDPLTGRRFILDVLRDGIRVRSERSELDKRDHAIEWVLKE